MLTWAIWMWQMENDMKIMYWRKTGFGCRDERSQESEGSESRNCGLLGLWQGDLTQKGL